MLVRQSTFDDVVRGLYRAPRLIVDTETTGLRWYQQDRVCGISVTTPDLKYAFYFPVRHEKGENLTESQYRRLIRLLMRARMLTGWNIKFDIHMLGQDGFEWPSVLEDVMLAAHLVNENDQPFMLKRWGRKYLGEDAARAEEELLALLRKLKLKKDEMWKLYPKQVSPYACDDVRLTERLRQLIRPALHRWNLWHHWREVNAYLLETAEMERHGMLLDVKRMRKYIKEATREEAKAYKVLVAKAGYEINVDSPPQMHAFFGLPSTRKEVLEELDTPEAEAVMSYRAWTKAKNTYYQPWLDRRDENDVLHPNLKLHGTVNGRQSAADPNLQAVPRYRKEYKVKDVVIARPGYTLVSGDYNQMELRMGVSVAQEENMAKLFLTPRKDGKKIDIHQSVADALAIERDEAKTINFMILYGGGKDKLSKKLKIPLSKATAYLEQYHKEYWHFRWVSNWLANQARYTGYIRLWSGRVRHFNSPRANPKDAFNSMVQGGGAEMLRIAIVNLGPQLRDLDSHMLLQIHDQIITEVPTNLVETVIPIIRTEMESFTQFLVPPKVDFKVGKRWGHLKDWEEVA